MLLIDFKARVLITNVVSFIEDNHRFFRKLFGDQVCNLWVQEVVVAVHYYICMKDLPEEAECVIILIAEHNGWCRWSNHRLHYPEVPYHLPFLIYLSLTLYWPQPRS